MESVERTLSKHSEEMNVLRETIYGVSADVKVLINDHKHLNKRIEEIYQVVGKINSNQIIIEKHSEDLLFIIKDLDVVKARQSEFDLRFKLMDEKDKYKQTLRDFFVNHWGKIVAVLVPLSFLVAETVNHLKELLNR